MGTVKTGLAIVAGGALLIEGIHFAQNPSEILRCVAAPVTGNWDACLPNFNTNEASSAKVGDLAILSEDLTGTARLKTYGQVAVQVGGPDSESIFDYINPNFMESSLIARHIPGVGNYDARKFWNKGNKGAAKVLYNPCIKEADDYTKPTNKSVPDNQPSENGVKWKINVSPVDHTVTSVDVDAGFLDACFIREDTSDGNNERLWTNAEGFIHGSGQQFGTLQEQTYRTMMRDLILGLVQSEACPSSVSHVDAIKEDVAKGVLGEIIADHPQYRAAVTSAYDAGHFNVTLADDSARQQHYRANYVKQREMLASRTETYPDKKGKTQKLLPAKLGKFSIVNCATANSFKVVGANS